MLVLTRKAGEDVYVGKNIRVIVLKSRGNRVTLGFMAPNDVSIKRGEIREPLLCEREVVVAPG